MGEPLTDEERGKLVLRLRVALNGNDLAEFNRYMDENARLREQLDQRRAAWGYGMYATIDRLAAENAKLREQNAALSEAHIRLMAGLEDYGEHASRCTVWLREYGMGDPGPAPRDPDCDCGLREALEGKP